MCQKSNFCAKRIIFWQKKYFPLFYDRIDLNGNKIFYAKKIVQIWENAYIGDTKIQWENENGMEIFPGTRIISHNATHPMINNTYLSKLFGQKWVDGIYVDE